jgi:tetratricopeptide (TPR) repeat protein
VFAYKQIRRRQLLREAEGYLDLATALVDRFALAAPLRNLMAQRALATLDRLDSRASNKATVNYLRGQALRIMQRYREAIASLERSAELDPTNIHIWLALGWCFKRTRRLDLAIQSLEEALSIDEQQAIVHYNLACYWSLAENPKLALGYLTRAFEIDPTYRDLVAAEEDFDPIREHPGFRQLTSVVA